MFPLLHGDRPNDLELFQIWLNLPARDKLVAPYFTMFWDQDIPRLEQRDADGRAATITVIAGALDGLQPLPPPPNSWAARPEADVAIWSIALEAGASWTVPPARDASTVRTLHVFRGQGARRWATASCRARPRSRCTPIRPCRFRPWTARPRSCCCRAVRSASRWRSHGPFVMNTRAELEQAFQDYRRTQFGGWPFPEHAPVHPRTRGRFARHADGRVEEAGA